MSTRYYLDQDGQLVGIEEPGRCAVYYRLAHQAYQLERGSLYLREIRQRLLVHLRHCADCSAWFVLHLAQGEAIDEPTFGEQPVAVQPAPAAAPAKPARPPRRKPDGWRTRHPSQAARLDVLDAWLGRNIS